MTRPPATPAQMEAMKAEMKRDLTNLLSGMFSEGQAGPPPLSGGGQRRSLSGNVAKNGGDPLEEQVVANDLMARLAQGLQSRSVMNGQESVVPAHITVVRRKWKHEGSLKTYREIKRKSKEDKSPFLDFDFEPLLNEHVKTWCRPNDIGASDFKPVKPNAQWYLFRGEPCVEDVRQGMLGDCWILSALSCLAEFGRGRFVRALFPKQVELCREGVYMVRLCLGGRWTEIILDDRIPCVGGTGGFNTHAAYCATAKRQIWASLVEKALAKVSGSYEALSGGETSEALTILTGWPCSVTHMDRQEFAPEELWRNLSAWQEAGFLVTCTTGMDSQAMQQAGLESQHAYSLMGVQQMKDKSVAAGQLRLLKIRNPQGEKLWNGAWSKDSQLWTPHLRRQFGYEKDCDEGVFFMEFEDFKKYFNHCTVCKIRSKDWCEVRLPLELPLNEPPCFAVQITATEATECLLSLAQPEKRLRYGPLVQGEVAPLACLGFAVLPGEGPGVSESGVAPAQAVARMRHRSTVSAECKLKAGKSYLLVPLSLHRGQDRHVTFACFSSKAVLVKEVPLRPATVRSAWAAYARHYGKEESLQDIKVTKEQGGILMVTQGVGSSIVALVENHGTGYLQAQLKMTSAGLRYTREESVTTDWLRPHCGQVVQVALPAIEQTTAGWLSIPKLTMSSELPLVIATGNFSGHRPELDSTPFHLLHKPFCLLKERPKLPDEEAPPTMMQTSVSVQPGISMHASVSAPDLAADAALSKREDTREIVSL